MKNRYIFLFFILSLSLLSCENFFEFSVNMDVPPHQPKLAPSAMMSNDTTKRTLFLSRSIGALDNTNVEPTLYVENASVRVNNVQLSSIVDPYLKGYYKLPVNFQFIPNTSYTLTIEKYGFETVTSQQIMPINVPIISASVVNDLVKVKFQDPIGVKNYYIVVLYQYNNYYNTFGEVYLKPFTDQSFRSFFTFGVVFNDEFFDGQIYEFTTRIDDNNYNNQTFKVKLFHISKELFLMEKSIELNSIASDNPFAEPSSMFTNVNNGYGIFGLSNSSEFNIP